ncbi:MAG: hypothetical protein ACRD1Z_05160, partial [Vicinamibacteria bacterium]
LDGTLLERKWIYYDGAIRPETPPARGDATRLVLWWDFEGNPGDDPDTVAPPVESVSSPDAGPMEDLTHRNPSYSMTYDSVGNPLTLVEGSGAETVFEYDDGDPATRWDALLLGPAREIDAMGHAREFEIDPVSGRVVREVDPNGTRWRTSYDAFGRKTGEYVEAAGEPETTLATVEFAFVGEPGVVRNEITVVRHVDPEGDAGTSMVSKVYLDGLGRAYRASVADGGGRTILQTASFDAQGRVESESSPYREGSEEPRYRKLEFGVEGELEREILPDGVTIEHDGHASHRSVIVRAAGGAIVRRSSVRVNGQGQIVEVSEHENPVGPPSGVTRYARNPLGEVEKVFDAVAVARGWSANTAGERRHVTTITRDSLGRRTSIDDPDGGLRTFVHDGAGDLVQSIDAEGESVVASYDRLHRPAWIASSIAGDPILNFYWDDPEAGAVGRLSRAISSDAVTGKILAEDRYRYNGTGGLRLEERRIDGFVLRTEYAYDLLDRVTDVLHPDGDRIIYKYGLGPEIRSISREMQGAPAVILRSAEYDGRSRPTSVALGGKDTGTPAWDYRVEREYDSATGRMNAYRVAGEGRS